MCKACCLHLGIHTYATAAKIGTLKHFGLVCPPNYCSKLNKHSGLQYVICTTISKRESAVTCVMLRCFYLCVSVLPLELLVFQREDMERSSPGGSAGLRAITLLPDRWAFKSKAKTLSLQSSGFECQYIWKIHCDTLPHVAGTVWLNYIKKVVVQWWWFFLTLLDCRISANTILCYCCGLRAFKELAFKYRQNIPPSELPGQTDWDHF